MQTQSVCGVARLSATNASFSTRITRNLKGVVSLSSLGKHHLLKNVASIQKSFQQRLGQINGLETATQKMRGGRSDRLGAGGARRVAVMWFRNDLRAHDNVALATASAEGSSLLPVYCFDPREYKSSNGCDATGPYRAQFILDAVADLRETLRAAGSDLIVRIGKPEEVLLDLAKSVGASRVYCHSEVSFEEAATETRVATALKAEDVQLKSFWGSTLFNVEDLPFNVEETPATYGEFRRRVEGMPVKQPENAPGQLRGKPLGCQVSSGDIPTLAQLGLRPAQQIPGSPKCRGGEREGLAQLERLLSPGASAGSGAFTSRNFCASFSQQISPWLAMGCLSPRRMLAEVRSRMANVDQTIVSLAHSELLWRDFFRFTAKKHACAAIARPGASRDCPQSNMSANMPALAVA